jgi:low affinity Fe/Cu permease
VLERFSQSVAHWTGSSAAFTLALASIVLWAITGPVFGFSDTWQLVINTATTIVTFLMVFLIQRAQNKDTRAIELKLNELIAALEGASNRMIDVEDLDESELDELHEQFRKLVEKAQSDRSRTRHRTIEETGEAVDPH